MGRRWDGLCNTELHWVIVVRGMEIWSGPLALMDHARMVHECVKDYMCATADEVARRV
jgi:hypothetical protein